VYDDWGLSSIAPSAGVVALLAGPSGTGKTLAAEVIAGSLGLDLFKIDLSAVVSKYIGETEKNLESVFRAAETGEAVLFFDEADAVFGRRSEVREAKDRYANIESAFLLQRIERSDALVLLATNLPRNIDEAFLRRIHVGVEFRMPEEAARRRIWERALPGNCPRSEVDLDWLAETFAVSGGVIAASALAAAFGAAADGSAVTMHHLVHAVREELRKQGRLVKEDEFSAWLADTAT
jgi:SpoVK/Ycf46/Vps4 family AAA+-type ATPase